MLTFTLLRSVHSRTIGALSSMSAASSLSAMTRLCSTAAGTSAGGKPTTPDGSQKRDTASINSVTLVGVVHDIQSGFVFEDAVTQFTLTTTSLDTTNPTHECVVEKDHHTIRCFGDAYAQDVKDRIKEGNVVCVNGRLRLNPQLEQSGKYYYFPFVHVQPPHGQVSVVYGDRRAPPQPTNAPEGEISNQKK